MKPSKGRILFYCGLVLLVISCISIVLLDYINRTTYDFYANVNSVQGVNFSDYDNKICSGMQVRSVMTIYKDKPISILVRDEEHTLLEAGAKLKDGLEKDIESNRYLGNLDTKEDKQVIVLPDEEVVLSVKALEKYRSYLIEDKGGYIVGILFDSVQKAIGSDTRVTEDNGKVKTPREGVIINGDVINSTVIINYGKDVGIKVVEDKEEE